MDSDYISLINSRLFHFSQVISLHVQRSTREDLESTIAYLTVELGKKETERARLSQVHVHVISCK